MTKMYFKNKFNELYINLYCYIIILTNLMTIAIGCGVHRFIEGS